MRRRMRYLTVVAVIAAATGCESSTPKVPPLAPEPMTGESVLRLPRNGGTATLLRPDLGTTINYRIPGVPAIARALTTSLADRTVYAVDPSGRLVNLDLLAGRCCTQSVPAHNFSGTPSGEVFGFDSTDQAVRLSDRTPKTYRTALIAGDVRLIRGPGTQVVAIARDGGVAQVIGDEGERRRIKIPKGEVAVTLYGELFAVITPDGLELVDPSGVKAPRLLAVSGTPLHAVFSPSGHRIYIARKSKDIVAYDRFTGNSVANLPLTGAASALRMDRTGRWLLARNGQTDSVWVIDATSWTIAATVVTPWADDLPAVTAGKNLLLRRGNDVVSLDLSSPKLVQTARLTGAGEDLFVPLAWVPKSAGIDLPAPALVAASPTVQADSVIPLNPGTPPPTAGGKTPANAKAAAAQTGFFIQVSSSQNQDWAKALSQQLKDGGFPSQILEPENSEEGYRVVVGPYPTRDEADAVGKRLGRSYFIIAAGPGGT